MDNLDDNDHKSGADYADIPDGDFGSREIVRTVIYAARSVAVLLVYIPNEEQKFCQPRSLNIGSSA